MGCSRLQGRGGPGPLHFFAQFKVKSAFAPSLSYYFWGKEPNKGGPPHFSKSTTSLLKRPRNYAQFFNELAFANLTEITSLFHC